MRHAIYFEFRKEDLNEVYQGVYIPSMLVGSGWIQPTYGYKRLTPKHPRRVWDLNTNPNYRPSSEPDDILARVMIREMSQLDGLHVYLESIIADPEWKTVGSFPVEVTVSDLIALKDTPRKMPSPLSSRIKDQRALNGFPSLPEAES